MVVDVIVRIESRKRQPRERWWKTAIADRLPNDPAPLGMIVTVKISTTDRGSERRALANSYPFISGMPISEITMSNWPWRAASRAAGAEDAVTTRYPA